MKLSLIIPAFNEEDVIQSTLTEVKEYLKDIYPDDHEIIVVDDGSTDKTAELASKLGAKVISQSNRGKGSAVKNGILHSKGDWILFMDADNSTKIAELEEFEKYLTAYDVVIGSRAVKGAKVQVPQNNFKRSLGRLGNKIIQLVLLPGIKDSRCGFKLYTNKIKGVVNQLTLEGFSFDDELLYLAKLADFRIKEVPVTWVNNFDTSVKSTEYITSLINVFRVKFNHLIGKYKI